MPIEFIDEQEIKEWCAEELSNFENTTFIINGSSFRPSYKSVMKCGNVTINNTRNFNWFQRLMWKLFFGFEIENIKEK